MTTPIEQPQEPDIHDEITVVILDTRTGRRGSVSGFGHWWWREGNGSCDCNRGGFLQSHCGIEVPDYEIERPADWQGFGGICTGCRCFLIVEAPNTFYSLREFNQGYPDELLREHGIL